jgi:hypothetical protein
MSFYNTLYLASRPEIFRYSNERTCPSHRETGRKAIRSRHLVRKRNYSRHWVKSKLTCCNALLVAFGNLACIIILTDM